MSGLCVNVLPTDALCWGEIVMGAMGGAIAPKPKNAKDSQIKIVPKVVVKIGDKTT